MGPRQDAGEDMTSGSTPSTALNASMGPRQDAGEDIRQAVRLWHVIWCFNGAPAGCRGRRGIFCDLVLALVTLQWGPGRMPGKTLVLPLLDRDGRVLQWGPGRMPGKTIRIVSNAAVHYSELQWGPGRMPGKTQTEQYDHHLSFRSFNGAPAGCRGRPLERPMDAVARTGLQWGPGRMPGKTLPIVTVYVSPFVLQWGPGRMPGKTPVSFRPLLRDAKASMGPRQDAGEDRI